MAELKKILISLPDNLLAEVDEIVAIEKKNRSEFIREAMKLYIREKQKIQMRERMKNGYKEMALINAELTELGLNFDRQALEAYESILSGRV